MALVVQTNIASLAAQKNLASTQSALSTSFNRLSSGLRINSASDDAAGLAISTKMDFSVRSSVVAERNANDGISMAQTAEGALGDMSGILGRMRELSVQAANGSATADDRLYMQTEYRQLQLEMERIQDNTKFNTQSLIADGASTAITFQVGVGTSASDKITVRFGGIALTDVMALANGLTTQGQASDAMSEIDDALETISTARARFGAVVNRFNVVTSNIQTARLNLAASVSRIRDVDVAEETAALSRNQVLQQAGAAILAQANAAPQVALGLLR